MSEDKDIADRLDELTGAIRALGKARVEANPDGKEPDGGRYAAALDGSKEIADQLVAAERDRETVKRQAQNAERKAEIDEAVKAALRDLRAPSMAAAIGQGAGPAGGSRRIEQSVVPPFATLKAAFRDYEAGEIFGALFDFQMARRNMDMTLADQAKAKFEDLGVYREDLPSSSGGYSALKATEAAAGQWGKATLGATGATGGYVLPNNLVDTLVKPAVQEAVLQNLVTVINGVSVRGVDMPYRTGAPSRMTFADWGTTKENLNEAYGTYTANLGTLARIYDIGKQYARFSAGAAEGDVMDELTKAAILGEN